METKPTVSLSQLPLRSATARCCMNNNLLASLRLHKRNNFSAPLLARSSSCPSAATRINAAATTAVPEPQKDLVFVAGATGNVGSRTVRELIKLGFRVRAAVRSAERASSLVKSVEQLTLDGETATSPAEKLEVVECDLEKQTAAGIAAAIGNAAVVVCSIGASEKEIFDVTGPYRIDYVATNNLVQAATAAKVDHFILVTSLGTSKIGFPAFLLNLFWGVLCWKRRAEEALIASGLPYTIVRPGGMERPTDTYKETHNLVLAGQDAYVGGQVSNLQVAELIACMAKNRKAAYCKVVEAIAETTAPLLPMEELLARIPSDREPPADAEEELPAAASEKVLPVAASEKKPPKAAAAAPRPLSPYTAYEGLKPPSSPSPTPSRSPSSTSVGDSPDTIDEKKITAERPPSPYTAYEGLKPPSSPTPRSKSSAAGDDSSPSTDKNIIQSSNPPLSPYTAFVDLKPPASPSPSPPPSASASPDAISSSTAIDATTSFPLLDSNANGVPISNSDQPKPLSPYARYEDLKPPSSPTPSAPKA